MIEALPPHVPQVHPEAYVHTAATVIGEVEIGPRSNIWPGAVLRGDDGLIRIGAETSIQDGTVVHTTMGMSQALVGDRVTVGHNVTLHGAIVEGDAIVGMGSILLDNCRIGRKVIIGAGTLVPMGKVVPDGVLVLGSPFKVVRPLTDKEIAWIEESWRIYVDRAERYRRRDSIPPTPPSGG